MKGEDHQATGVGKEAVWVFLLGGYILGFVMARLLTTRWRVSEKTGAFIGGLGTALSGGSLVNPWRV